MEFEWDTDKAESNWRKHKVNFLTATRVFEDPFLIEYEQADDDDILRYTAIGMVEDRLLVVTFTMRANVYRIISARLADRHERRTYHEV